MERLHPGVKWQFRFGGYFFFCTIGIFFGIYLFATLGVIVLSILGISDSFIIPIILFSILVYILFAIVVSEVYARMSYNRWFYEFNDDCLKLERGIIWKRYSNVPYERIQNVDIHRGIIARMFGFSSLMIQTAGYSAKANAEGYIPAVEISQAEQIRTFVMKKITRRK